jgi:hypothetical protein
MKRITNKKAALQAAWTILCKTGNWHPYVEAFKALYGTYPVYIPQH